jgi:hypothetical protein
MAVIADDWRMTREKTYPGGRLSTGQAAKLLFCSVSYLRTIDKEKLDYVTVGNRRRYLVEDVQRYSRALKRK